MPCSCDKKKQSFWVCLFLRAITTILFRSPVSNNTVRCLFLLLVYLYLSFEVSLRKIGLIWQMRHAIIYMYIFKYIYIQVYVLINTYTYVCTTYIHIYIYIYIYIYMYISGSVSLPFSFMCHCLSFPSLSFFFCTSESVSSSVIKGLPPFFLRQVALLSISSLWPCFVYFFCCLVASFYVYGAPMTESIRTGGCMRVRVCVCVCVCVYAS